MSFNSREVRCKAGRTIRIDTRPSYGATHVEVCVTDGTNATRGTNLHILKNGNVMAGLPDDADVFVGGCAACVDRPERACTFNFQTHQVHYGWLHKVTRNTKSE